MDIFYFQYKYFIEYKEAKKNLPSNLFESVCSMLNRNGGHIFLGVKDQNIPNIIKRFILIKKILHNKSITKELTILPKN